MSKPTYEQLAEQVRQLTEQRDAAVAENADLKDGYRYQIGSIDGDWFNATKSDYELIKKEGLSVNDKGHYHDCPAKTPATDAILDSLRAEGVEMFASAVQGGSAISDRVIDLATDFARQLRESKGAQS